MLLSTRRWGSSDQVHWIAVNRSRQMGGATIGWRLLFIVRWWRSPSIATGARKSAMLTQNHSGKLMSCLDPS